jgi:hypothetical protein
VGGRPMWDVLSHARGINHPNLAGVKDIGMVVR